MACRRGHAARTSAGGQGEDLSQLGGIGRYRSSREFDLDVYVYMDAHAFTTYKASDLRISPAWTVPGTVGMDTSEYTLRICRCIPRQANRVESVRPSRRVFVEQCLAVPQSTPWRHCFDVADTRTDCNFLSFPGLLSLFTLSMSPSSVSLQVKKYIDWLCESLSILHPTFTPSPVWLCILPHLPAGFGSVR